MRITDAGIRLPRSLEDRIGVELQGRQVWAFVPARDGRLDGPEHRFVPWPGSLRPYLRGSAEVTLRSLDTRLAVHGASVVFGDGSGVVSVRDREGRALGVDKGGRLTPVFSGASDVDRGELVAAVVRALDTMRSRGHDAFLAYGNLLGAVRDGRLIGHDNDADVVFLAKSSHPADVVLASFRLEREFLGDGWRTSRMSGGTFKLWTRTPSGQAIGIDVFCGFHRDGLLHVMPTVVTPLPRTALLPTSTVVLEGQEVPAPAEPGRLLEATYGPGWQVPDPTFTFHPARRTRRRLAGYFRGLRRHRRAWDAAYQADRADPVERDSSSFARWVATELPRPASVLEVGSGTGRDALWMAEQGVRVVACDYSSTALALARAAAAERGSTATFRRLNLYDVRQVLSAGALLAHELAPDGVYARFLVDALEDEGRHNLWRLARTVLAPRRGRLMLELRVEPPRPGRRSARLAPVPAVLEELRSYGFDVQHCQQGRGLAVLPDEDPLVCRIAAERR